MHIIKSGPTELGAAFTEAAASQLSDMDALIDQILNLNPDDYTQALTAIAENMRKRCGRSTIIPDALFRAFDGLDHILGLDYNHEEGVEPASGERIYAGSGAGVQSSYATILHTLEKIEAKPGATMIDLGSGYGRVGLLLGLLRRDMQFIGFEYVGKRVACATASATRAGLSHHVRFFEQDLAQDSFVIPNAEFYYMYDPFSPETYRRVLAQMLKIGRAQSITVITKGDAGTWLAKSLSDSNWSRESFDLGNMSLFRSPA